MIIGRIRPRTGLVAAALIAALAACGPSGQRTRVSSGGTGGAGAGGTGGAGGAPQDPDAGTPDVGEQGGAGGSAPEDASAPEDGPNAVPDAGGGQGGGGQGGGGQGGGGQGGGGQGGGGQGGGGQGGGGQGGGGQGGGGQGGGGQGGSGGAMFFSNRKTLTIQAGQVAGNLTDHVLPVILASDAHLAALARADGRDIAFYSTGGAKLPHEVERFDKATGALVAWVRLPSVSSAANTAFRMYFGNANAPDQGDAAATWTNLYEVVMHMTSAAPMRNSVGASYQGTATGPTAVPQGQVGDALAFTGEGQYVTLAASGPLLDGWDRFTISLWVSIDEASDTDWQAVERRVWKKDGPTNLVRTYRPGGSPAGQGRLQSDTAFVTGGTQYLSVTVRRQAFTYVAFTYDGQSYVRYSNGVAEGQTTLAGDRLASSTNTFYLGSNTDTTFRGRMDEVRIARAARSGPTLLTEYNAMTNPAAFLSVGALEPSDR